MLIKKNENRHKIIIIVIIKTSRNTIKLIRHQTQNQKLYVVDNSRLSSSFRKKSLPGMNIRNTNATLRMQQPSPWKIYKNIPKNILFIKLYIKHIKYMGTI